MFFLRESGFGGFGRRAGQMKTLCCCITFAVGLLNSSSDLLAQITPKEVVRVFNVIPIASSFNTSPDQLNEAAFSVHNRADEPLEWLKIRIIRNPTKEISHSEEKEINFVKYMGKPLAPGVTKQMSQSLYVRGYRTSGASGAVELRLIDFRLSEKGRS
jgi:hypothetical protein